MRFDLDKTYDFSEKVIVVTGGTGVLLRPAVEALLERQARVVLLSRTRPVAWLEQLADQGYLVTFISVDVCQKEQLLLARDRIMQDYDRVDILINGAGGNRPGATTGADQPFFDLPAEALQGVMDVNFAGLFYASQVFGEVMAQQNAGVILNISSMAGIRPLTRVVGYSAAKAAVNNFTQWLAVHLAQEYSPQIRVNALAPGFLLTDQNRYLLMGAEGALTERGEQILAATPQGQFGEPEDMLGAILWLISDAARFVTGAVIPVDGGFSAFGGV
jgi:NAD(P)-dependent dehydrogenase (short-subunit alcohol dehydrogenase family)